MAKVTVHSLKKRKVGDVELPDSAYDYPLNRHLMYEAVRHYLATGRRGTHDCKNRVEVRGAPQGGTLVKLLLPASPVGAPNLRTLSMRSLLFEDLRPLAIRSRRG